MFEVSLADLNNDEDQAFRKMKLRAEDVQGKNVLTNFYVSIQEPLHLALDRLLFRCFAWWMDSMLFSREYTAHAIEELSSLTN